MENDSNIATKPSVPEDEWCYVKNPSESMVMETAEAKNVPCTPPAESPKSLSESVGYSQEEQSTPEFVVEHRKLTCEIEQLQGENLRQASRIGDLQRLNDANQTRIDEQASIISELHQQLTAMESTHLAQMADMESLIAEQSARKQHEIEQLRQEISALQQQASEAEQSAADWKHRVDVLKNEQQTSKMAMKDLTEQLITATQQIAELTLRHQQMHAASVRERQAERSSSESTIQSLRHRIMSLEMQGQESNATLEEQLQVMSQAVGHLQADNEQLQAQLMTERQQRNTAYEELRNEVETYKYLLNEQAMREM